MASGTTRFDLVNRRPVTGDFQEMQLAIATAKALRDELDAAVASIRYIIGALEAEIRRGEHLIEQLRPSCAARESRRLKLLTERERAVLALIADGRTSRQIAHALELAVKTVDAHRLNIMTKLDLHSAVALARFAVRSGLVQP
jgi:DNA-binding NarL/FixJ family response regulator